MTKPKSPACRVSQAKAAVSSKDDYKLQFAITED